MQAARSNSKSGRGGGSGRGNSGRGNNRGSARGSFKGKARASNDGKGGGRSNSDGRGSVRGSGKQQHRGSRNDSTNTSSGGQQQSGNRRNSHQNNQSNNQKNKNQNSNNNQKRASFKPLEEIELWERTGFGSTEEEKAVIRLPLNTFFNCRMQFLDAPGPEVEVKDKLDYSSNLCRFRTEEERMESINEEMKALWNFEPLKVDDQTRWKSRVMLESDGAAQPENMESELSVEERLGKATGVLNKLSWTTMDKLTASFLMVLGIPESAFAEGKLINKATEIDLSAEVIHGSMVLIVDKAMGEPHFAELYASFCGKLAGFHKAFKKTVLSLCQEKFEETDKETPAAVDDGKLSYAERQWHLDQMRKKSIGLMKFIGELYQEGIVKSAIMLVCLQRLFQADDEEKLECFTKLMSTVGSRFDNEEKFKNSEDLCSLWDQVYSMAGKRNSTKTPIADLVPPSNRIKFLLQDLIELKENRWITRRKEDKAMTIEQIHEEIAAEEAARSIGGGMKRSQSGGQMKRSQSHSGGQFRQSQRSSSKVGADGFTQIVGGKGASIKKPSPPKMPSSNSSLQRAVSAPQIGKQQPLNKKSSLQVAMKSNRNENVPSPLQQQVQVKETLSPKQCGEKTKSILKEYFIGGDKADAVLSISELVVIDSEGHLERGAAVMEAGILLVMEMKEDEVRKFLELANKCFEENKADKACLPAALNDPLEFLRDIQVDAPKAPQLLATIMADWLKSETLPSLRFLESAPEYFRTDGKPAEFCAQVLIKHNAGNFSDDDVRLVENLMTEQDKKEQLSGRQWLQARMPT